MVTCHDSASCEDQTQAAKLSRYRVCHALVDEINVNNIAIANSTAIGFTAYPPGYSKAIMWLHAAGPTTDTLLQRMASVSGLTLLRLLLLLIPEECGSRSQGSRRREGPNHWLHCVVISFLNNYKWSFAFVSPTSISHLVHTRKTKSTSRGSQNLSLTARCTSSSRTSTMNKQSRSHSMLAIMRVLVVMGFIATTDKTWLQSRGPAVRLIPITSNFYMSFA